MLHQLAANFACLSFGAGQVVHGGLLSDTFLVESSCLLRLENTDECSEGGTDDSVSKKI